MSDVTESHIEVTPGVKGGRPRIAGRRITVQDIVVWHEHLGLGADEISAEYDLTLAEIHAALAYYFDHRQEIDRDIRVGETLAESLRKNTSSALKARLKTASDE